ncbi:MAG TPA: polymer-forming cytoskeletal protein [Nitrospira sp.]|nr:polymer-forming cytoskeletal protein [Nitrospira sp.]
MWSIGEKHGADAAPDENFTFLSKGVDFKGIVNFDGTIRIDGRVEGEINTSGTLIIGEQAVVKGVISAGILITSGKVHATITATAKIQIQKPGILIGDIRTPGISIEDGAHFHGMCDMGAHKWVDEHSSIKTVHDPTAYRGKARPTTL